MAVIALLAAAAFGASPAKLVLGKDAGADLVLRASARAHVTITASVGTVSEPGRDGDVWRARFTPPSRRAPSVALILAQVEEEGERDLHWLSIPLAGSDTMEIETRPDSEVEAEVAGATIGPVTSDGRGIARLPMVVPPGVQTGRLRITDKLGNMNEKQLDLDPPPYARLRVATRTESAAVASPLEVEIFVVRPDGTPDDRAKVDLDADDGDAEIRRRIGPGTYLGRWVAPAKKAGTARLVASANGQTASLEVPVTAGKVRFAQPFWESALVAQQPWSVSAGVLGGGGQTFDGAGAGSLLIEAAMRLEILPLEAVLEGGSSYFTEVTQGGGAFASDAKSHSWLLQAGVRAGRQFGRRLDGHLSLLVGAQNQIVDLRRFATVRQSSWTPRAALAAGLNLRVGPGRVLGQVQFDFSSSGAAGLTGSLGGVQLLAGYLMTVR